MSQATREPTHQNNVLLPGLHKAGAGERDLDRTAFDDDKAFNEAQAEYLLQSGAGTVKDEIIAVRSDAGPFGEWLLPKLIDVCRTQFPDRSWAIRPIIEEVRLTKYTGGPVYVGDRDQALWIPYSKEAHDRFEGCRQRRDQLWDKMKDKDRDEYDRLSDECDRLDRILEDEPCAFYTTSFSLLYQQQPVVFINIRPIRPERTAIRLRCMSRLFLELYAQVLATIASTHPESFIGANDPLLMSGGKKKSGQTSPYTKQERRQMALGWLHARQQGGTTLADYANGWAVSPQAVCKYVKQLEGGQLD